MFIYYIISSSHNGFCLNKRTIIYLTAQNENSSCCLLSFSRITRLIHCQTLFNTDHQWLCVTSIDITINWLCVINSLKLSSILLKLLIYILSKSVIWHASNCQESPFNLWVYVCIRVCTHAQICTGALVCKCIPMCVHKCEGRKWPLVLSSRRPFFLWDRVSHWLVAYLLG